MFCGPLYHEGLDHGFSTVSRGAAVTPWKRVRGPWGQGGGESE